MICLRSHDLSNFHSARPGKIKRMACIKCQICFMPYAKPGVAKSDAFRGHLNVSNWRVLDNRSGKDSGKMKGV